MTLAYEMNMALVEAMSGDEFPDETPGEYMANKFMEILRDEAVIREVTSTLEQEGVMLDFGQVAEVHEALIDVLRGGEPDGTSTGTEGS